MKKLNTIIALILLGSLSTSLMAQLSKGQILITGNLSFFNSNESNSVRIKNSNKGAGFNLAGGYFFKDHTALSLAISIYQNKNQGFNTAYTQVSLNPDGIPLYTAQNIPYENKYNTTEFSIGINRYISLQEKFALVLSGTLGTNFQISQSWQRPPGQTEQFSKSERNNVFLNFSPGLIYFLSPHLSIGSSFGGLSLNFEPKSNQNTASSFSGSFLSGNTLQIGLGWFF